MQRILSRRSLVLAGTLCAALLAAACNARFTARVSESGSSARTASAASSPRPAPSPAGEPSDAAGEEPTAEDLLTDPAVSSLPDYYIFTLLADVQSDGAVDAGAAVRNRGRDAALPTSLTIQYRLNGTGAWTVTETPQEIPPLAEGAYENVYWYAVLQANGEPLPAGTHELRACADATSLLAESDETNNCGTPVTFTVPPWE